MRKDAKLQKARWRQRERLFRQRRASRDYLTPNPPAETVPTVQLVSYDVTFDYIPATDPDERRFERSVGADEIATLYGQVFDDPKAAIPQLEKLCQIHPNVPLLWNWLLSAYGLAGDEAKSEAIGHELYERYPNYLFALVKECHAHIRAGDLEWVANRLDKKWDLKLLYPDRDLFHFTEVRAFQHLLICYFIAAGNVPQAKIALNVLEQLDPDDKATAEARFKISIARARAFFRQTMDRLRLRRTKRRASRKEPSPPKENDSMPLFPDIPKKTERPDIDRRNDA